MTHIRIKYSYVEPLIPSHMWVQLQNTEITACTFIYSLGFFFPGPNRMRNKSEQGDGDGNISVQVMSIHFHVSNFQLRWPVSNKRSFFFVLSHCPDRLQKHQQRHSNPIIIYVHQINHELKHVRWMVSRLAESFHKSL